MVASLEVGALCAEWGGERIADGGGGCGQEWVGNEEEGIWVMRRGRTMV